MTVIVSVKINDGLVMASDSASTFGIGQIYLHADKIVNLVKGLPIGAMVTGSGQIGNESITTLLKDLRARFEGFGEKDWKLNPKSYTVQEVAKRVREFLFEEKTNSGQTEAWMQIRVCGYSAGRPLSEVWEIFIRGKVCDEPTVIQGENDFGIRWDGEYDALNRLIFGGGKHTKKVLEAEGIPSDRANDIASKISNENYQFLSLPAMPIQDAIDLGRFLVETTINFKRFSVLDQPKTVGGAVEIAAITKHEGFRWVERKHFYEASLNPPPNHSWAYSPAENQQIPIKKAKRRKST